MAIAAVATKNTLASAYAGQALYAALFTTVPGATAGTEVSGGSYARVAVTWGSPTNGVITGTAPAFNVPAGVTIAGAGYFTAATGGTYVDGVSETSQAFATAGTYQLTGISFTQS
jgi:hypothetical protein